MGVGRELFALRKDGTEMRVEIGLNPIALGGERFVLASVIDITERLRGQEAEKAVREDVLRRSILDSIPFCIIATDSSGRIVTANPAAESLLGYAQAELVGRWITEIDGVERARYADGTPALSRVGGDEAEWTYRHRDGHVVPVAEAVVPMDVGDEPGFIVVAYDITHRIEARDRAEHLATHDSLTNLPNRGLLVRHLESGIRRSRPGPAPGRPPAAGRRPLQADQRLARPPHRRRDARGGRGAAAGLGPPVRRRGAPGR